MNTTLTREGLHSAAWAEDGGLSGQPLRAPSTATVAMIAGMTRGGRVPIVAAGGVNSLQAAREKLDAGACLVQVYTGLVYQGPGLVRSILNGLA